MNTPKINRLVIFSFFLTWSTLSAEIIRGEPQRITSPDQVPKGLAPSDWTNIRAAYEAERHAVKPVEGEQAWRAINPGQQWHIRFDSHGFLATPTNVKKAQTPWQWGLALQAFGWAGEERPLNENASVTTRDGCIIYQWDAAVSEWFVNDRKGLEHGFTIAKRPDGGSEGQPLTFALAVRGTLRADVAKGGQDVVFRDEQGNGVLNYAGLKAWDANGKILTSCFKPLENGKTTLHLEVDDRGAHYPITIDPLASSVGREAYLKASNAESNDQFGYAVAVSGNTAVVSTHLEDSNGTGVNPGGGAQANNSAGDAGAAYVFERSGVTWTQQAYLKASNTQAGDNFGKAVAISGDTIILGAPMEDSNATGINGDGSNNSSTASGAAYVFVRNGTTWTQEAYIKASDTQAGDHFGNSVAISGDTAVVGAEGEDTTAANSGATYVFVRSGTTWSQQAKLKASNPGASDQFGLATAISGNFVIVGAHLEDSNATGVNPGGSAQANNTAGDAGAAYIFTRSGTTWSQEAYVKASNTDSGDWFGSSVGIDGNTAIVGAYLECSNATGVNPGVIAEGNNSANDAGAAYVFIRTGTTWSQQAYLKASYTDGGDNFGYSTSISGNTVFVGAPGESSNATGANGDGSNNGAANAGAVYAFTRSGTTWSQQAYLKASNTEANDSFGSSVAVSGEISLCGAIAEKSNATGINGDESNNGASSAGAVYVYTRHGGEWADFQQGYLKASNTDAYDGFGESVAISGDTVVVGAKYESSDATEVNGDQGNNDADGSGAAYVYVRSGTTWSQQAYLKASNAESADFFGSSVAIWGDTICVGAPFECSGAAGVNGNESDNSVTTSGAVYVFVRSGTNWSQEAYLKASNPGIGDQFGSSISISNDTVVVGAIGEDSNATGINGNENDNSATFAGAAYVFTRSGTTWSQQAYLKASNNEAFDVFGSSVSVFDDTIVVTSWGEDSNATGINGNQSNNSASASGAAYVFVRSGTTWSQQAYLKASNTESNDGFGDSAAISGDTIVVGAYGEDSNATGVNGNQADNSIGSAGAAYVFVRSGTTWSQQAYLKASNTEDDFFGESVDVSRDTIVVGAWESSNATGVNGNQNDNSKPISGAAYVFVRSGTTWSQQAYLKASNPDEEDYFGSSVGISGDTVVVGAFLEDSNATGINGNGSINSELDSGAAYVFSSLGTGVALQLVFDQVSVAYANPDESFSAELDCVVEIPFGNTTYSFPFVDLGGNWHIRNCEVDLAKKKITYIFFEYLIPSIEGAWFWTRPPGSGTGPYTGPASAGGYPGLYPKPENSYPQAGSQTLHFRAADFVPTVLYYDESPDNWNLIWAPDSGPADQRTSSGEVRLEAAPD